MKKIFLLCCLFSSCAYSQKNNAIPVAEVSRIEQVLASDAMRGRRAGTPDIDRAAAFIADEFRKAGLQPLSGQSFLQSFSMLRAHPVANRASVDGREIDPKNIIAITLAPLLNVDEHAGYELAAVKPGEDLRARVQALMAAKKNTVIFVDSSFAGAFPRLSNFNRQSFGAGSAGSPNTIFVLASGTPASFSLSISNTVDEVKLANVVGVLPGRSKKNEYVVFSGHYDHLGVRQPVNGDSIYNGANDDAAGTTAVILLANYYRQRHDNERTLIFVAFTAEEIGGYGSQYFSRQLDPAQVVAMFNIEMIGTESKWGRNSAYITGFEKSDMGRILQSNLQGTDFQFYPDPYPAENLFYRSDNATLARLGVPAHTISTSKMDNEPNYHKVTDEISTLDMDNMASIISAIAQSATSIVNGKDTPSRVKEQ